MQTKETAENPEVTALKVTEKTAAKAGARAADAEITSEMTQAEIQKIVDEHDTVIIRGGVYQDISVKTNKTTVFKVLDGEAPAEFKCSGKPNEYGPFGFLQNSGDLSFQFEKNAKLKIENYGAGIYQSSTAKDVSLNISGYGILEITGSHNSNPGSAAGMFLHSIGKKALKINGNSDEERMTVRCNGNQAAGIDWYPSSLDKDDPLEFVCKYTNLYTSNNSYNGINFQTDNGVERNHNSVYAKVTDSYFEASGNTGAIRN